MAWLPVIALIGACADGSRAVGDRARFHSKEHGFSCAVPEDWTAHADRGSIVLSSPENPRRTIAVRSLELKETEAAAKVSSATETVLRGLPGVADLVQRPYSGPLNGVEWQLTFEPERGCRYARRHVLLTGKHRAFHVFETSPAPVADDAVFLDLVQSLHEES